MMSASAVKPTIPTTVPQVSKVGPGPPPPPPPNIGGPPKVLQNLGGSPNRPIPPPNSNHSSASLPLSLVQEHKSGITINQVNQQPLPVVRTPDSVKDHLVMASCPVINKPTSNGVENSPSKSACTIVPSVAEVKKPGDGAITNHTTETPAVAPICTTSASVSVTQQHSNTPPTVVPTKAEVQNQGVAILPAHPTTTNHALPPVIVTSSKTDSSAGDQKTPDTPAPVTITPVVDPPVNKVVEVAKRTELLPKPEFKVATPPRNTKRKRDIKLAVQEAKPLEEAGDDRKSKRVRTRTQPYQSPIPELMFISKIKTPVKSPDDKLIVFYKNEFLAVRNAEGSFYVCQAMQNIYKTSPKIRIRWLSQEKKESKLTDVYTPDFYDATDFDCILTNLELKKLDKNRFHLPEEERERTNSILKRALDVEKGVSEKPSVTEEHPDGLDLSLFRDESQLKTKKVSKQASKRKKAKGKENAELADSESDDSADEAEEPKLKKLRSSPKKVEKPKAKEKVKEKSVEVLSSERRERTSATKRKGEVLSAASKAALVKQAAVKQTVARQALPKPFLIKKNKTTPPSQAKQNKSAQEPTRSTKTRKGEKKGDIGGKTFRIAREHIVHALKRTSGKFVAGRESSRCGYPHCVSQSTLRASPICVPFFKLVLVLFRSREVTSDLCLSCMEPRQRENGVSGKPGPPLPKNVPSVTRTKERETRRGGNTPVSTKGRKKFGKKA
uniref:Uncharacterized protein n=1 Tax=Timema monikensis TaxID=170555 RepID=A0A7R9E6H6_9NEOP|nr:unnamed protein product [Timema monikensis]